MQAYTSNQRIPRPVADDTLIAALFEITEPEDRWLRGFNFERDLTLPVEDWAFCHDDDEDFPTDESVNARPAAGESAPRGYRAAITCLGRPESGWAEAMSAEVVAELGRRFSAALAHEWWTGTNDNTVPYLSKPAGLLFHNNGALDPWQVGTTVVGDVDALNEDDLGLIVEISSRARPGDQLMIHAPIALVHRWLRDQECIRDRSGRIATQIGLHRVVTDPGYPRTGPGGATAVAGTAWVYVTGACGFRRTAPEAIGDAWSNFDRSNNRWGAQALAYGSVVDNGSLRAVFKLSEL